MERNGVIRICVKGGCLEAPLDRDLYILLERLLEDGGSWEG